MSAPRFHDEDLPQLEIVPFPEVEEGVDEGAEEGVDVAPVVDRLAGDLDAVVDAHAAVAVDGDLVADTGEVADANVADADADAVADADADAGTEVAADARVDAAGGAVPEPVVVIGSAGAREFRREAGRREADASPAGGGGIELSARPTLPDPVPAVRPDPPRGSDVPATAPDRRSGLRSLSLRSRIAVVATVGAVVAGLLAIGAIWSVVAASNAADHADAVNTAATANAALLIEIREIQAIAVGTPLPAAGGPGPTVEARLRDAATHDDRVVRLARGEIDGALLDAASAAQARFLDVVGTGDSAAGVSSTASFADAVAARQAVDRALSDRGATVADDVHSARTTGIVALLVALIAGVVALAVVGQSVARSIIEPMRALGRAMRRFGDGDLSSRAEVGPDEVGTLARSFNLMADVTAHRVRRLSDDAARGSQLRVITEALDLADDETDVYRIVEHAMSILAPSVPMELLVDEGDEPVLHQVAVSPSGGPPNCPVEESGGCVAIRRGQVVVFDSPSSINACPRLRGRPSGPCSAACVPVTFSGRLLGVLHLTGPDGRPPADGLVQQLSLLAAQAGARIGAMRTLESTRHEASTDGLTGLANRRRLESHVGDLLRVGTPFVLAVGDLDRFKRLNDTYGHEVGDRALQLFAQVLAENVRDHDLVARLGGEEFVLVFPGTSVHPSIEAIERIRVALDQAVRSSALPPFTCSFGVTHSSVAGSVDGVIRVADAGLLMAKELGRNRVVFADAELAAEVFAREPTPIGSPPLGADTDPGGGRGR